MMTSRSRIRSPILIFVLLWAVAILPAKARDVSMVTSNWGPFFAEDIEDNGFYTALVRAAFATAGHNANIQFYPWKRALALVENGQMDLVMGAYFSEDRNKAYLFSDPVYNDEIAFLAKNEFDRDTYKNLRDLAGLTNGIGRGWFYSDEFEKADYFTKEEATNQVDNLRKLLFGRINLFAASKAVIQHEIQMHGETMRGKFKFLDPPLRESQLHLMISRNIPDGPQLVDDFNRGLAEIRANGTYEDILKRFGQTQVPDS